MEAHLCYTMQSNSNQNDITLLYYDDDDED